MRHFFRNFVRVCIPNLLDVEEMMPELKAEVMGRAG